MAENLPSSVTSKLQEATRSAADLAARRYLAHVRNPDVHHELEALGKAKAYLQSQLDQAQAELRLLRARSNVQIDELQRRNGELIQENRRLRTDLRDVQVFLGIAEVRRQVLDQLGPAQAEAIKGIDDDIVKLGKGHYEAHAAAIRDAIAAATARVRADLVAVWSGVIASTPILVPHATASADPVLEHTISTIINDRSITENYLVDVPRPPTRAKQS